jgi:hypothetical protein
MAQLIGRKPQDDPRTVVITTRALVPKIAIATTSIFAVALTLVFSVSAARGSSTEPLTLTITVTDSGVPPDPGCVETDPTWLPLWTDSGSTTEVANYDLAYGSAVAEIIDLNWSAGEAEVAGVCEPVAQAGTVTTDLSVTAPPGATPLTGWSLLNGCVTETCAAAATNTITATITPPAGLVEGDVYAATVTLTWTP